MIVKLRDKKQCKICRIDKKIGLNKDGFTCRKCLILVRKNGK